MGLPTFDYISLCPGGGGLDLGLRVAVPNARAICYVENEVTVCEVLAAHIEAGGIDPAPIWTDIRTFDGAAWRGVVDCIITGFPCQPFSTAGKRGGEGDERNLWPDVERIIGECQPGIVFLENVPGILRYYFERIRPGLRDLGYDIAEGLFSAAEVGASQLRQRLFALAHCRYDRGTQQEGQYDPIGRVQEPVGARKSMVSWSMADADSTGFPRWGIAGYLDDEALDTERERTQWQWDRDAPGYRRMSLFPPLPGDTDGWARVLAEMPEAEPALCRLADGLALDLVPRTDQLRILGNGVVPLQAAYAFSKVAAKLNGKKCWLPGNEIYTLS